MSSPTPPFLIDDQEEPSTIWVPGHLTTAAERRDALAAVMTEWEGLVELLDVYETTPEGICATASMVWQRRQELSDEDRRSAENWYDDGIEFWEDCDADDESATPWTALVVQ